MALPLHTHAHLEGFGRPAILKVVDRNEFIRRGWPPERCALMTSGLGTGAQRDILALPWGAGISYGAGIRSDRWTGPTISEIKNSNVISCGDVISISPARHSVRVLFRRGANSNVLFTTDRCNSHCLMCSQPPKDIDDRWRVDEILELIGLIDKEERHLGITGGEPTLLGHDLVRIIAACKQALPTTELHILTNGRLFGSTDLAFELREVEHPRLLWAVPLYGDTAALHDFVVQAKGAFDETIRGLYRLAEAGQSLEIRIVLHRPTVARLPEIAEYIFWNLPFVKHVALMGIEPIGLARQHYGELWNDPADYADVLKSATYYLANRGIPVSIYNLPLCVLHKDVWPFARKSISDWKNQYLPVCEACKGKELCCGFFTSTHPNWQSRQLRPLTENDLMTLIELGRNYHVQQAAFNY